MLLLLKRQNKKVVPLDICLDNKKRILIISGPNAGGKSVCLKTVGLLQYMIQCGILVPMFDNSRVGIFNDIFIDIGTNPLINLPFHPSGVCEFWKKRDKFVFIKFYQIKVRKSLKNSWFRVNIHDNL